MSEWSIRRGGPEDLETLLETARICLDTYVDFTPGWTRPQAFDAANEERMPELLRSPGFFCLMAEANGDPVGQVMIGSRGEPGMAHLGQLFVRPVWWGTGVAKELHAGAVAHARETGFERIRLFTPRHHPRARRFYEREGWVLTGEPEYSEDLRLEIVEYRLDL